MLSAILVWLGLASPPTDQVCQPRYVYAETIRADLSGHDAMVLAWLLRETQWRRIDWCKLPANQQRIVFENSTAEKKAD